MRGVAVASRGPRYAARGAAADGFSLLAEVDGPHAALTDHVEDLERADVGRAVFLSRVPGLHGGPA
jgi:hypothetical protein